jgi:hypothetical protein
VRSVSVGVVGILVSGAGNHVVSGACIVARAIAVAAARIGGRGLGEVGAADADAKTGGRGFGDVDAADAAARTGGGDFGAADAATRLASGAPGAPPAAMMRAGGAFRGGWSRGRPLLANK